MNVLVKIIDYVKLATGVNRITFETQERFNDKQNNQYVDWLHDNKLLNLDIQPFRKKRSLDSNAYF